MSLVALYPGQPEPEEQFESRGIPTAALWISAMDAAVLARSLELYLEHHPHSDYTGWTAQNLINSLGVLTFELPSERVLRRGT